MSSGPAAQQISTYVFTDLVDSTRLTRVLPPPVWRRLKDRHDELVRESAATAGGQVVKALGDGFLIVFTAEEPAIRFAIATQRAVRSGPWDEGTAPEIRIGMDTGPALYRSEPPDFEGDAVNVASHICSRARPGEVLLSARAYYGARPWLDRAGSELKLEPVGEVRLKGLPTLEALYRAWAPGLREGYPPLVRTGNLASHLGPPPFIDREAPLQAVLEELDRRPVVTLLGPGGMGKTRLATEVGRQVETRFPAGVWVAPLEGVSRGEAVAAEILGVLGFQAEAADPDAALLRQMEEWQGLLILDNVEQLVEEPGTREAGGGAFTRLVGSIARRCLRARVLCTSRIDLRLGDTLEARVELQPLARPAGRPTTDSLKTCPSAQLCTERLRLRVRQFVLNESTTPHVAAICQATEGIPLLIELAAGQLGRRTLPEIARDVERVLVDPSRDADRPDRHRDLVRLLDWSLDLLGDERDFFLRLGVFRGGFDAAAAQAVTDEPQTEEFLQRLMDAHLVIGPSLDDFMAESPRYRLLGATASYCRSRLGDELPLWGRRHAWHYGEAARAAERDLHGTAPRHVLARLKEERENLSAAFDTALEDGDLALAAAIGGPLWELLHRIGLWPLIREDAQRLLDAVHQAPRRQEISRLSGAPLPYPAEAVARMALAQAAHDAGQMVEARDEYRSLEGLYDELEDRAGAARTLHGLGNAFRRQNIEAAERSYQQSLELAIALGDEPLRALNLVMLGLVASSQGRLEDAEQRLSESVSLFRLWDDPWSLAIALNGRAQNLERMGQLLRARDLYAESLEIKRELEDRRGTAITLLALARLVPRVGEPEAARQLLLESLGLNRELGDAWGCAVTLGSLAERLLVEGQAERALELTATARQSLDALGGSSSAEAAQLDSQLQTARARVPTDRADACERRGRETPIMQACDAVLHGAALAPSG